MDLAAKWISGGHLLFEGRLLVLVLAYQLTRGRRTGKDLRLVFVGQCNGRLVLVLKEGVIFFGMGRVRAL